MRAIRHARNAWCRIPLARAPPAQLSLLSPRLCVCLLPPTPSRGLATVASSVTLPKPVQLRPYQEESILAVLKYLQHGERRLGVSLATGSGKTVIFSHLIDRVPEPVPGATQTLILAHRRELVEQAARHCQALYPNKKVDIEMGVQHASGLADITVASVQSLVSGDRLSNYRPENFKLVLVDEAHHIVAPRYLDILRHFRLADRDASNRGQTALVGVSATFSRSDGLKLGKAIDHIVYHKDYVDMIDDEWLANLTFTTVKSGADLSRVRISGGDFQTGSLSKAVNNHETNHITVRAWLATAGDRKSTLVFCVDLSHVAALTAAFRAHGIDAKFITGDTHAKIRSERLDAFKSGQFPVLLNCGIFTEGTDIPNIDCVLLARPTRSRNLLVQMIGRGLRLAAGKVDCRVIDMVASLETGIVTTPTLFGLDPDELAEGADSNELKKRRDHRHIEKQLEDRADNVSPAQVFARAADYGGPVTFTHYDSVNDLLQDTRGERHIRMISQYAWVQVDHNRYMLSDKSGTLLTIKVEDDGFSIVVTPKLKGEIAKPNRSPFGRPLVIASASTFEDAVHAADTYASAKFVKEMIRTSAAWRKSPASETQLAFLNKHLDEGRRLDVDRLTKGRAADWITKIKHGAKGRLSRIKTDQAKLDRVKEKNEKWKRQQEDSVVKVGPLEEG